MSNRSEEEFLADILEATMRAISYIDGISYEEFIGDQKSQDAVIRTLEIAGEATKRLSFELRESYSSIPWKSMAGLRDKLIHDYFGVNLEIVWTVVDNELPAVVNQIQEILTKLAEKN
ncbi:MAG: DUF86 domain-containing protein [Chloroflexota bacterium]